MCEALINEQGAIEPHAGGFSVEPFLRVGRQARHVARCAADAVAREGTICRFPTVSWTHGRVAARGDGVRRRRRRTRRRSMRAIASRIAGDSAAMPTLYLAVRPFQVNPRWQFLDTQGGVAPIRAHRLAKTRCSASNDTLDRRAPHRAGRASAPSTFDAGRDRRVRCARGALPARHDVQRRDGARLGRDGVPALDSRRRARDVYVLVPLHEHGAASRPFAREAERRASRARARAVDRTRGTQSLEPRRRSRCLRSAARVSPRRSARSSPTSSSTSTAPPIQPGSRSYARSWIRDGSLIGAALLRLGHRRAVREFLEWYAPLPVPQRQGARAASMRAAPIRSPRTTATASSSTSSPSTIRYTRRPASCAKMWPHVRGAVAYMDSLRAQRMHARVLAAGDKRAFYGLFPSPSATRATRPSRCTRTGTISSRCAATRTRRTSRRCSARERGAASYAAMRDEFRTRL